METKKEMQSRINQLNGSLNRGRMAMDTLQSKQSQLQILILKVERAQMQYFIKQLMQDIMKELQIGEALRRKQTTQKNKFDNILEQLKQQNKQMENQITHLQSEVQQQVIQRNRYQERYNHCEE